MSSSLIPQLFKPSKTSYESQLISINKGNKNKNNNICIFDDIYSILVGNWKVNDLFGFIPLFYFIFLVERFVPSLKIKIKKTSIIKARELSTSFVETSKFYDKD